MMEREHGGDREPAAGEGTIWVGPKWGQRKNTPCIWPATRGGTDVDQSPETEDLRGSNQNHFTRQSNDLSQQGEGVTEGARRVIKRRERKEKDGSRTRMPPSQKTRNSVKFTDRKGEKARTLPRVSAKIKKGGGGKQTKTLGERSRGKNFRQARKNQ